MSSQKIKKVMISSNLVCNKELMNNDIINNLINIFIYIN